MDYKELETPCVVVDLDKLEGNVREMAELAEKMGLELWPMIKTHKSSYIVNLQLKHGAKGILAAKLEEAEKMVEAGVKSVILAYPIIGKEKLNRLIRLTQRAEVFCSIDSLEAARLLNEKALGEGMVFDCIIIIDSGLKRLGIQTGELRELCNKLKDLKGIRIVGVATHGGHVYGATDRAGVLKAATEELEAIQEAAGILMELGIKPVFSAIGSTPTVKAIDGFELIKQIRPGNYVFYDAVQVALGVVPADRCALSVLATVLSVPEAGRAVMDAGSKILCLDAGAHGNDNIKGYGIVKERPEVLVKGLSEELGRLVYDSTREELKVGDVLEIIPNHACTVVNMVDKLYGIRNGIVEMEIEVTARGAVR